MTQLLLLIYDLVSSNQGYLKIESLILLYSKIVTINCIIFSDFLMFCQTFLSPQVKRCAIITYKHDIFNFPRDLPNN